MAVKHKLLGGKGSGKYLGFATQKVGRLAEEARGRAPSRTKRYTVDNGMVDVKVSIQDEQHYIKITRRSCPAQLNGLADFVFQNVGEPGSPNLTPIHEVPDPNNPTTTINVFRRFYPSPATKPADRAWRDERGLAKSEEATQQLRFLPASMFSGEMRKVVQILQGRGEKVPYSPTFALTHGVFVASTGQRWVIEVSNGGVYAWPMGMCRNPVMDGKDEVLPYTPIGTPAPQGDALVAAIAAGTFKVLLDASGVQPAFNKFRFFKTCGWAFNTDGHAAVNVCWDWPGVYKRSYLYHLTITETDGGPSSAALGIIEEGQIYGPRSVAMKYPETGSTNLFSFDTSYGSPGATNADGPVYAYYNGDQMVVVRYANFPASSPRVYNDTLYQLSAFSSICESQFGRRNHLGTITTLALEHFTSTEGLGAKDHADNRSPGTYDCVVSRGGSLGILREVSGDIPPRDVSRQQYSATQTRDNQDPDSQTARSVIIIPWGDRECFLFVEEVTINYPNIVRQFEQGYAERLSSRFINTPSSYCPAVPSTVIAETVTGEREAGISYCADGSEQWRLRLNGGGGSFYPGVQTGQTFMFKSDAGLCNFLPTTPLPDGTDRQEILAGYTEKTYQYVLYSSGAARRDMPALPDVFHWNRLLEYTEDGSQNMGIFRDACDPGKFIMSPDINQFGGAFWLSTAAQYPVAETGSVVRFVGVA